MEARRDKKPKPLGICTVCRAFTDEHMRMNHRCVHTHGGRRCWGIYQSSLTVVWNECPVCHAAGRVGSLQCNECAGWEWVLHSMT